MDGNTVQLAEILCRQVAKYVESVLHDIGCLHMTLPDKSIIPFHVKTDCSAWSIESIQPDLYDGPTSVRVRIILRAKKPMFGIDTFIKSLTIRTLDYEEGNYYFHN